MAAVPRHASKIPVYSGDTFTQPIYVFEEYDPEADPPIEVREDVSGWTEWLCQWRPTPSSSTVITLAVDTTEAANGEIVVSATAEQTADMGRDGVIDVQAKRGAEVRTFGRFSTDWELDVSRG